MYFKFTIRKHPETGSLAGYYRLVESYCNADDRVCHRNILNVGFMDGGTPEQLNRIQRHLTGKYEQPQMLFEESDPMIIRYAGDLWQLIIDAKKIETQQTRALTPI